MSKRSILAAMAPAVTVALAGCGEQGYGPTHSYSARYDGAGTAANNGSVSSSVLTQEYKERNYYGY